MGAPEPAPSGWSPPGRWLPGTAPPKASIRWADSSAVSPRQPRGEGSGQIALAQLLPYRHFHPLPGKGPPSPPPAPAVPPPDGGLPLAPALLPGAACSASHAARASVTAAAMRSSSCSWSLGFASHTAPNFLDPFWPYHTSKWFTALCRPPAPSAAGGCPLLLSGRTRTRAG